MTLLVRIEVHCRLYFDWSPYWIRTEVVYSPKRNFFRLLGIVVLHSRRENVLKAAARYTSRGLLPRLRRHYLADFPRQRLYVLLTVRVTYFMQHDVLLVCFT